MHSVHPDDIQPLAPCPHTVAVCDASRPDQVLAWSPPLIQASTEEIDLPEALPSPTVEEIEAIHADARREGYEQGFAAGFLEGERASRAEGEACQREIASRLLAVIEVAARPLDALDEAVVTTLVDLSICIARQIIRRELRTSPGEVVAVVREAIAQLPMATSERKLHLHPEDVPIVRHALGLSESEHGWHFEADPLIARGGCRIETESSYIDASVEARVSAVVRELLGGERADDLIR
jgi:flagellar assembly protein FliH